MSDKIQNPPSPEIITPMDRGRHYSVTLIEKTGAPMGGDIGNWYRYIINDGNSTITGTRSGNKKQVSEYAEQYAKDLNERGGMYWRSRWSPTQSKPSK